MKAHTIIHIIATWVWLGLALWQLIEGDKIDVLACLASL